MPQPSAAAPNGASYQEVMEANVRLHSVLASEYRKHEPHFRPENVAHVDGVVRELVQQLGARRVLDLGCGTGFMIDIAKRHVEAVDGVDITPAMLAQVDRSGPAKIRLFTGDTGSFTPEGTYDLVTSYSFLHHLRDIEGTLRTAYRALRPGGAFYADLDPNYYFWEAVSTLDPQGTYDPILRREIDSVVAKDEEIAEKFGVTTETFNLAEYMKSFGGGFREEDLRAGLGAAGFSRVDIRYYWYLGQAQIIHDPTLDAAARRQVLDRVTAMLTAGMPLSRTLFKYVGFIAYR